MRSPCCPHPRPPRSASSSRPALPCRRAAAQYAGLSGYGLSIAERVPCVTAVNAENVKYLRTKQQKMGHWLPLGFDDMVSELEESGQLEIGVGPGEASSQPAAAIAALREATERALTLDEQVAEATAELARLRALLSNTATNGVSSANGRAGTPGGDSKLPR